MYINVKRKSPLNFLEQIRTIPLIFTGLQRAGVTAKQAT